MRSVHKLLELVCVAVFFAVMYTLIIWVTLSFVLTANGPVKWKEGWVETKKKIFIMDDESEPKQSVTSMNHD